MAKETSIGIIGRKLGMAQTYTQDGTVQPLTAIEAGPCTIIQVKTEDKEGYNAVQLGFGAAKHINSAQKGHLKENGQYRHLREFRIDDVSAIEVGQKIDVNQFKDGDVINIVGVSKGKGFAGGVKRHHFRGGPKTHGQSDRHRAPGSAGANTYPGHVFKGLRMAGHLGDARVTVQNLKIAQVDVARNLLLVIGAVPGAKNGLLLITKSARRK